LKTAWLTLRIRRKDSREGRQRMPEQIHLQGSPIDVPAACCCCGQPETNRISLRTGGTRVYYTFPVPYCGTCLKHVKALNCPSVYVYLWVFAGGVALFAVVKAGDSVQNVVMPTVILAPIAWWWLWYRWRRRARARTLMKPTCCTEGYAARFGSDGVLTLHNKVFAEQLRQLNPYGRVKNVE
jgi:hypothetical protein